MDVVEPERGLVAFRWMGLRWPVAVPEAPLPADSDSSSAGLGSCCRATQAARVRGVESSLFQAVVSLGAMAVPQQPVDGMAQLAAGALAQLAEWVARPTVALCWSEATRAQAEALAPVYPD